MSASQHRRSCAELGLCQARVACMECEQPTVPVIRMVNSRRVHTLHEPTPFRAVRPMPEPPRPSEPMERCAPEHRPTRWFWPIFGSGATVLLSGLVLYAK